jgi:hypothetical protein
MKTVASKTVCIKQIITNFAALANRLPEKNNKKNRKSLQSERFTVDFLR